ncbi:MAG: leucyl/phenylalanyl-tRNA--protein transferase [Magnetococcales bacterium]|nr:leucyl/phenylalanyl-tRNA--protein transferase [Magnetococcales bacterium]
MPVYYLPEEPVFPPPSQAEPNGLVAVGGDLSPERLIAAYSEGIFPWFSKGDPFLWWSPDPRLILTPERLHISRSLAKTIRRDRFHVTFDCAFESVVRNCSQAERGDEQQGGTWITDDMLKAYVELHRLGYAHSVEAWLLEDDQPVLAGGAYGVALGRCFFGESMFHCRRDASKVAFVAMVKRLEKLGVELIDCQMKTEHLLKFGAWEIPREQFIKQLHRALTVEKSNDKW